MNCSESLYGQLKFEPRWYALATRYHHEQKVHARLQQKAITSFLPLHSTWRDWSDRQKKISEPLFSCYIFVKIALQDRLPVLQTDGVIRFVSFDRIPAPIPESQIEAIRRLLAERVSIEILNDCRVGQPVEVTGGPFKGMHGILQKKNGNSKLVIAIEALRQAIAVEMDASCVRPVERNPGGPSGFGNEMVMGRWGEREKRSTWKEASRSCNCGYHCSSQNVNCFQEDRLT